MEPIGASERIHKTLKDVSCKEMMEGSSAFKSLIQQVVKFDWCVPKVLLLRKSAPARFSVCVALLICVHQGCAVFRIKLRMPVFQ